MRKVKTLCRLVWMIALFIFALPVRVMMTSDLSGGFWDSLAEVLKATTPTLIPGVVDDNYKRGNPVDIFPFVQANHTGEYIRWLRESANLETAVADIGPGGQTTFSEGATFSAQTAVLRACYLMTKLDSYDNAIWQTVNDYERMALEGMMRDTTKKLGSKIIYDDYTYDGTNLSMDGLHAWAATQWGQNWDIDGAQIALRLENMRILSDEMKHGFDFWLMPFCIARQIDRVYREAGIASLKSSLGGALGLIQYGLNEAGGRTLLFDNKPIIRSDFMVAEEANTGQGTTSESARAAYVSGTRQYSIFATKLGATTLGSIDPGVKIAFGKTENDGEFFNLEYIEKMTGYIGKGLRLAAYTNLIVGSKWGLGRITDITNTLPHASV